MERGNKHLRSHTTRTFTKAGNEKIDLRNKRTKEYGDMAVFKIILVQQSPGR